MCATHSSPSDFKHIRHRWEMPLIWVSTLITAVAIVLGGWVMLLDEETATALFGDASAEIASYASYAALLPGMALMFFIIRFYMAAKAKANAVRVGPRQMPEIWQMYQELNAEIGLNPLPNLYVTNGNGVVNAYALSCNTRRKYIVLHSEIAMTFDKSPELLRFVLAHEMAHHKLGHVSLWRLIIGVIPGILKPLGTSTTRAQEYSADRLAVKVCSQHQGAMGLLVAGPWMYGDVDMEAWLEQCEDEHREFYVRIANLLSDHAVMVKRYKALHDIEKHGFSAHGEMF